MGRRRNNKNIFKLMAVFLSLAMVVTVSLVIPRHVSAYEGIPEYVTPDFVAATGMRYNLKVGKQVKIKSYIPYVGALKYKVKLDSCKITKETIDTADGRVLDTNRVQATIIITCPKLSEEDAKKLINAETNGVVMGNAVDVFFVNNNNAWYPETIKSPNSTQSSPIVVQSMGQRKVGNITYDSKYRVFVDCSFRADEHVVLGVTGIRTESHVNFKMVDRYRMKLEPFTQTPYWQNNGAKLSTWMRIS